MKDMLKKMLENDKKCVLKLEELKKKNISYDKLWNDILYSEVSSILLILIFINIHFINICLLLQLLKRNYIKKGYYIRHIKENLWVTFGIYRIKPFDENFTSEQEVH